MKDKEPTEPSPIELNRELRKFYEIIPPFVYLVDPTLPGRTIIIDDSDTGKNRSQGELLGRLTENLRILLSKACLTNACREYILAQYETSFIFGYFDKEKSLRHPKVIPGILKVTNEASAGIFDEDQASLIERNLLRRAVQLKSAVHMASEGIEEIVMSPAPFNGVTLDEWRREFVSKYNDEP